MNIFCDYHHQGLARSMFYLFASRLGHTIKFPSADFAASVDSTAGIWGRIDDETWLRQMGGISEGIWHARSGFVSRAEFNDTRWDLILMTRTESQPIMFDLARVHPSGATWKYMAQSGNENMVYDWVRVPRLLASDEDTWRRAPATVAKILTVQEVGRHFFDLPLADAARVTDDSLRVINCMINNLPGQGPAKKHTRINDFGGGCPHCGGRTENAPDWFPFEWWRETRALLPGHKFCAFGHNNEAVGGVNLSDKALADQYRRAVCTWHVKGFDGWGHSMLQSIACGRPVIVRRGFYRYRTAGRFLIPGSTCFEVDGPEEAAEAIKEVSRDVATANQYAERCADVAATLFDFGHESERVRRWLQKVL